MSTTEDHKERQVYELGYLILPSVTEDSLSNVVDSIKGIMKKVGGEEIASEDPIKIDLAYTMTKSIGARKYVVNDAYIGWVKFECEPSSTGDVDGEMKKLEGVLRFLLVKAPRETTFTFAQALKAKEDKIKELEEAKQAPVEAVPKVVE
ncbi:MAG: 30S ribosomal protein S6 [Patescibacteria group bacterium]